MPTVTKLSEKLALCSLLFTLFFCVAFANPDILFLHFDIGWHIELGNVFRQTGALPEVDSWSSTAHGHRFVHWYWLWSIASSYLFDLTGDFRALFIFTAVQGGIIVAIVALNMLERGGSSLVTLIAASFFGASRIICTPTVPSLTISARTLSFLFFVLTHLLLFRIAVKNKVCEAWWLVPLIAVWGNVHRLGTLAIPALGLFFLQCVFEKKWKAAGSIAAAATLGFTGAMLIHPMHFHAYELFVIGRGDPSISTGSVAYDFAESSSALFLTAFIALAWFARARPCIADRLHVFFWLYQGLKVTDAAPLFVMAAAPVVGELLQALAAKADISGRLESAFASLLSSKIAAGVLGTAAVAVIAASPGRLREQHPGGMDYPADVYPLTALTYLQEHYAGKKTITDWKFGGFIIHKTHGSLPVWVDGRSTNSYPIEVLRDAIQLVHSPRPVIDKYQPEVMFMKRWVPTNNYLDGSPEWKQVYVDTIAVIYERIGPPMQTSK